MNATVMRVFGLISLVVSLSVGAYLFAAQSSSTGGAASRGSKAIDDAQIVAATFTARRAESVLGAYRSTAGTYAGADLSGIAGARLLRADSTSFCLQIVQDGVATYDKGPDGEVGTTPC